MTATYDLAKSIPMHPWASSRAEKMDAQEPIASSSDEQSWFDCTSPDIGFDDSCFECLDDQLLYHPVESFADICWAEAVRDIPRGPSRSHKRTPDPIVNEDQDLEAPLASSYSLPVDSPTLPLADRLNTTNSWHPAEKFSYAAKADTPTISNLHPTRGPPAPRKKDSFVPVLLPFNVSVADPSESIGFFPTPRRANTTVKRRPSRFLAYFRFHGRPLSRM